MCTSRNRSLALSGLVETSAGVASEPSFTNRGTDRIAITNYAGRTDSAVIAQSGAGGSLLLK